MFFMLKYTMFCDKFQLHLSWDAKLMVHGERCIPVLKVSVSGIGQKGLVPLFWIHLFLPLFWSMSGISFTGKARHGLQKEGGRKCPFLTCTLIQAQDIAEQLRYWNTLKYLLRYLCQSILSIELFLMWSGWLCWGSRLKLFSWLQLTVQLSTPSVFWRLQLPFLEATTYQVVG